jgi:hypothetical protein
MIDQSRGVADAFAPARDIRARPFDDQAKEGILVTVTWYLEPRWE